MKRGALQNSKRVLAAVAIFLGLFVSIPVQEAVAANDVQASCVIGSSSSCPAQSPQEIYNLYGTTTNGTYWLNVNGTATQTYLVLDTAYPDGGMWFLGMKGTRAGTSFTYASTYWTSQSTTLVPDLTNDVASEAKYNAFNYLPITQVVAVFKDRASYNFSGSGTGVLGASSFGGHTWKENITAQTMYARFTTAGELGKGTGALPRYDYYRESNSSGANLVFAYQSGYYKYGFAYDNNGSNPSAYRWGAVFNNEQTEAQLDSSDAQMGIGLRSYSAASVFTYSDIWGNAVNGSTGANNGSTATYQSGFQIWGKMAAPSLATPGALTVTNQGSGSVQLSFAASSGATEYAIQYKTAGSNWSSGTTVRLTNPSATPSATLAGFTSGNYDFRVFARATNNSSAGNSYLLAQSIDATSPTISSIGITSSSGSDSIYGAGDVITATVNWSETVTVAGSPRMLIEGLTSKYLTYASGSGSTATTFTYTVTSGDVNRSGISVLANALALNGGSITDASQNIADRAHSAIVSSLSYQVDGTSPSAPSLMTASDGSSITLTYSETLSATTAANTAFIVSVNGVTDTVTGTSIALNNLRLFLTFNITSSATVTLTYSDPTAGNDANAIQDEAGNDAPSFTSASVTNISSATSNTTASIALNPVSTTATYRANTTIRVSVNTIGKVDFYMAGKIIPKCRNISTSANIANCTWKPAVHAYVNLTARFRPSGAGFTPTTTSPLRIFVTGRSGNR